MKKGRWRVRWRRWRRRLTPAVLWDGLMVYLALLNVGLIVFDLTYLWLRPLYFDFLPIVTSVYDRVKEIEPHPRTARYLETVDALAETSDPDLLAVLRQLGSEALVPGTFDRSGQTRNLVRFEARVRHFLGVAEPDSAAEAGRRLWTPPGGADAAELERRLAFFDDELRPLLAVNYHRDYDLDGNYVDYFWLIDLPFLLVFALEFAVRWFLAVRRRTYPKWFLFPVFHWYDLLGLVPVKEMRFFRLFRVASIYVRLYKSDRTSIGDDVVSRTVRYFANAINEEISDMVSLRILNETQEELKAGTHRRIIRAVAAPRRDALAREVAARTRTVLASVAARQRLRAFLDANLSRSVESAEVLRRIPLPNIVVRPLVETIGGIVFDAIVETLDATLSSPEGRAALEELVAASIDGLVEDLTTGETEEMVREISIDAIEHVKEAVRVRKWVEAEKPPGKPDMSAEDRL